MNKASGKAFFFGVPVSYISFLYAYDIYLLGSVSICVCYNEYFVTFFLINSFKTAASDRILIRAIIPT